MNVPAGPAPRREILAWAFYDFGNSAFATTILAVVFQRYFTNGLGAPASAWGYSVSLATIVSAVMLPVLGAVCDYTATKKIWLSRFWVLGCLGSVALFLPTTWESAAGVFMLALIGFEASTAVYNSFLPELADRQSMTRVSSFGWAFGYLGGGLHLAVALGILLIGSNAPWSVRVALGSVGLWWFAFGIPTMRGLRERAVPRPVPPGMSLLVAGFRKVGATLANIRRIPTLAVFTVAYLLFSDAIQTVIVMSSGFGDKVLKIGDTEMILCFLMIQGVAFVGALSFGRLAARVGDRKSLIGGLIVWIGIVAWGAVIETKGQFWLLGALVGLVMGGTQAVARSMLSRFTPPTCAAEFFGFYSIVGKFASALGPALYAFITDVSLARGATLAGSFRIASLSIGLFFVAGLLILLRVNESLGIAEAEAEERRLTGAAP